MKISKPKGHLSSWLLFLLLYLPSPVQPPRCHINHISHATLCPLMSMPDICHGPWPMSYYYLHNNTSPPLSYPTLPCQRVLQQQDRASLYLSHTHSVLSITAQIFRLKIKLVYLLFWKEGSFWVRQHMFAYFMLSRIVHDIYISKQYIAVWQLVNWSAKDCKNLCA